MLDRSKLAVVHIAKKELGLDEDNYREALMAWGGAYSAKDLSDEGFKGVMRHFEEAGFRGRVSGARGQRPAARTAGSPLRSDRRNMASDGQIKKIYKTWWMLSGTYYKAGMERKALREFLKKRFRCDHENFLSFEKARQVIEAIKNIGRRELG